VSSGVSAGVSAAGSGGLTSGSGGPAELVLMASVARRYYLEGQSKVEIAEHTELSRFKVARLLEKARSTGLVRIEIGFPGPIDVHLSDRLQEAYGLRICVVLDVPDDDLPTLRGLLGRTTAELLSEIVEADDVLGLAWGRSLSATGAALTRLPPCTVVQLTGALPTTGADESSTELVREAARLGAGTSFHFYAPMIVSDAQTAQALRQQPEVARAISRFRTVTKALVGLGSWDPPFSTVYDALTPKERRSLHASGVRAEVSGILIGEDGDPVASPLAERTIGIDAEQLRRVPDVLAIAYGSTKARAVAAALRGRLVNGLVTHRSLALALVEAAAGKPTAGPPAAGQRPAGPPAGANRPADGKRRRRPTGAPGRRD
jgi:DNA-binding transcriptional regulator LsrR (DeoR family)